MFIRSCKVTINVTNIINTSLILFGPSNATTTPLTWQDMHRAPRGPRTLAVDPLGLGGPGLCSIDGSIAVHN